MFGLGPDKRQKYVLFGWHERAAALVNGLLHNIFHAEADKAIRETFRVSMTDLNSVIRHESTFGVAEWKKLYDNGLIEKIKIVRAYTVEDAMLYVSGAAISSVKSYEEDYPRFYLPGDVLISEAEDSPGTGVIFSRKGATVRIVGEISLN